ncbi:MAG: hypothetical protein CBB60_001540, partial [Armatimonadetes bacterium Cent15-Ar3]
MPRIVSVISLALLATAALSQELPRRGALGLQMAPLSADEAKSLGLKAGVKASTILPGLTAEALKLAPNDVLISLNRKAISTTADVTGVLRTMRAGENLIAVVNRGGKTVTLQAA